MVGMRSAKNGSEELFEQGLLAVGNIDNSASGCGVTSYV